MEYGFLRNQPHPETDASACVLQTDAAAPLRPALDIPVLACGGAWAGCFFLLVAKKDEPRKVYSCRGPEPGKLGELAEFASFELPVTGISCFESETGPGVCVSAGDLYLFDIRGNQIGKPGLVARHASALWDGENRWLAYDGKLRKLNKELDGFAGEAAEIRAAQYFLAGTRRQDALHAENRNHPGLPGGCLFKHKDCYYYFLSDRFRRYGEDNLDTFCCTAGELNGRFERRYLLIPNGGIPNVFHGDNGKLYAAFIGGTPRSAVYERPAILPLETRQEEEFLRPDPACILEAGTAASLKPVGGIREIRDSFILNAPDGYYYLTGTTRRPEGSFWADTNGVCVWRGRDLENFECIGKVFDYRDRPESWQNQVSRNHNCWAPEIAFYDNTFWISYSTAPGCGLLKSRSGKIEGPYQDMGRFVIKGIDAGFFQEEDRLYLIWQNGRLAPLSRDCVTLTEEPILLLPEDGRQVGYEGAGLIKVRGRYVLYAAEWNGDARIDGTYDMMYSVADKIEGPYRPRSLLVPHGGHGCLFYDKEGSLRFTIFGNDRSAPFRRKVGIGYVRIEEKDGELFLSV
jgi:hypothetical protein